MSDSIKCLTFDHRINTTEDIQKLVSTDTFAKFSINIIIRRCHELPLTEKRQEMLLSINDVLIISKWGLRQDYMYVTIYIGKELHYM